MLKSYKFREVDMIFKGDAAFVCFVADVESTGRRGRRIAFLQICDFSLRMTASGSRTAVTPGFTPSQWKNDGGAKAFGRIK